MKMKLWDNIDNIHVKADHSKINLWQQGWCAITFPLCWLSWRSKFFKENKSYMSNKTFPFCCITIHIIINGCRWLHLESHMSFGRSRENDYTLVYFKIQNLILNLIWKHIMFIATKIEFCRLHVYVHHYFMNLVSKGNEAV